MAVAMKKHNWVPSTLGHGETMCRDCWMTNREAAALRCTEVCEPLVEAMDSGEAPVASA